MVNMKKTYMQKTAEVERQWHLVDVKGKVLGRVSTEIAQYLMGKLKPTYTPHIDSGDYVVVINATKVELTRNKEQKKIYRRVSQRPGGMKEISYERMMKEHPERIIQRAVKNMLPKNKLRADRMNRLKVFPGAEHPYQKQVKFKE